MHSIVTSASDTCQNLVNVSRKFQLVWIMVGKTLVELELLAEFCERLSNKYLRVDFGMFVNPLHLNYLRNRLQ